jgi:hypothetical protein
VDGTIRNYETNSQLGNIKNIGSEWGPGIIRNSSRVRHISCLRLCVHTKTLFSEHSLFYPATSPSSTHDSPRLRRSPRYLSRCLFFLPTRSFSLFSPRHGRFRVANKSHAIRALLFLELCVFSFGFRYHCGFPRSSISYFLRCPDSTLRCLTGAHFCRLNSARAKAEILYFTGTCAFHFLVNIRNRVTDDVTCRQICTPYPI